MSEYETLLQETAKVWCPDYPRRVAGKVGAGWGQLTAHQSEELVHNLIQVRGEYPGYVSTYSFPNGHPTDDQSNIPNINTLMLDFDIDIDGFSRVEWARQMKKLLDRMNAIAEALLDEGKGEHFRWSLSGYKGVHIYLDFPEISEDVGTANQIRYGMETFADLVILKLKENIEYDDLEDYLDVCSGWDLSRLTRLPNTVHEKATDKFGEEKFCVPVTTEEMADIGPSEYVKLTREPRLPETVKRNPQGKSKEVAERHIKISPKNNFHTSNGGNPSTRDDSRVSEYKENVVNDRVNLSDVAFLLKRKPCIWSFRNNDRMFKDGHASHVMETQSILAMISIGTPIEVMHDFFKSSRKYDRQFTQKRIEEILSRDYSEFDCSKVLEQAEQFCLKQNCKIYRGDSRLQKNN